MRTTFTEDELLTLARMGNEGRNYFEILSAHGYNNSYLSRNAFYQALFKSGYRLVGLLEKTPYREWASGKVLTAAHLRVFQLGILFYVMPAKVQTLSIRYLGGANYESILAKYQLRYRIGLMRDVECAEAVTLLQWQVAKDGLILLPDKALLTKKISIQRKTIG